MRESNRKNRLDSSWLEKRAEGFTIVHSMLLSKIVEYPSSFVVIKSTIEKKLMLEHPFVGNHIGACWPRNKRPGVVGLQGCELLDHGVESIMISKGTTIRLIQRRQSSYMKIKTLLGLAKTLLASCDHVVVILHQRVTWYADSNQHRNAPGVRRCRRTRRSRHWLDRVRQARAGGDLLSWSSVRQLVRCRQAHAGEDVGLLGHDVRLGSLLGHDAHRGQTHTRGEGSLLDHDGRGRH
jgi:hypothetical protein